MVQGAGALFGLAGYSYYSGQKQLELQRSKLAKADVIFGMRSRKAGITSIAFILVGMGYWRLIN